MKKSLNKLLNKLINIDTEIEEIELSIHNIILKKKTFDGNVLVSHERLVYGSALSFHLIHLNRKIAKFIYLIEKKELRLVEIDTRKLNSNREVEFVEPYIEELKQILINLFDCENYLENIL